MRAIAFSPPFRLGLLCFAGASLGWIGLALGDMPPAQTKTDDVTAVLEQMRQAAGGTAGVSGRPAELLIEGKVERSGSTSDYSVRFKLDGMFLQTLTGPCPVSSGSTARSAGRLI